MNADEIFVVLRQATLGGLVVFATVLLIDLLLGRRLSPRLNAVLWALVLVRLMLPATPRTTWSVLPSATTEPLATETLRPAEQWSVSYGPLDETSTSSSNTRVSSQRSSAVGTVITVWLAGFVVASLVIVARHAAFLRRLRHAPLVSSEHRLSVMLPDCAARAGVPSPRLRLTENVGPAAFGVFRPTVLLPVALAESLSPTQLRGILLHELVHLRRRDPLWQTLSTFVRLVHWFNPLAHIAAVRCGNHRELATDAATLALLADEDRATYVHTLIACACRPPLAFGLAAWSGRHRQLRQRIAMIANYRPRKSRPFTSSLLVVAVVAVTMTAARSEPVTKPTSAPTADEGMPLAVPQSREELSPMLQRAEDLLDQPMPELRLDAVAFADAIDSLRDLTPANIVVNWRAFDLAGIDRTRPVTLRIKNVSLRKSVRLMLDQIESDKGQLDFTNEDGVVTISTREQLAENTATRVYDIRDLIIPGFGDVPTTSADERLASTFGIPHGVPDSREAAVSQLLSLITETIASDSWKKNGGTIGSLKEVQGQLIVTQTAENHGQIATLLRLLRAGRALQLMVEARFVLIDPTQLTRPLPATDPHAAILTEDEATRLLAEKNVRSLQAPRVTMFNGQHAGVQLETPFTRGPLAIWPIEEADATDGKAEKLLQQIALDVTGVASADRKSVRLSLRPRVSKVRAIMAEGTRRETVWSQTIETTLSVPDGQAVLVRCFDAGENRLLYLLVKPTLIVQREIEPPAR